MSARLRTIDMYAMYWGQFSRQHIMEAHEIGTATASKSIGDYMDIAPGNIQYSHKTRTYNATKAFTALNTIPAEDVLELFAYGRLINHLPSKRKSHCAISLVPALEPYTVAVLTRAIVSDGWVRMTYISASSGQTERLVKPNQIFNRGGVWYLRGYDCKTERYRTFRIQRVTKAAKESYKANTPRDEDWESSVVITIAPHTRHKEKSAIKFNLGLKDQFVKNITTNKVLAPFDLIDWRVDCSANGDLDPEAYPLQLMNRGEIIDDVDLTIAPGIEISQ